MRILGAYIYYLSNHQIVALSTVIGLSKISFFFLLFYALTRVIYIKLVVTTGKGDKSMVIKK